LEQGLIGDLGQGRTRILVTHHIGLVSSAASFVVELGDDGQVKNTTTQQPAARIVLSESSSSSDTDLAHSISAKEIKMVEAPKKFVEDEKMEVGRVKWSVYQSYVKAAGGPLVGLLFLALFSFGALLNLGRSYWIKIWTSSYGNKEQIATHRHDENQARHDLPFYLGVYVAFASTAVILDGIKMFYLCGCLNRASRALFKSMTFSVLHAKLRWLDQTPVGRSINRFVGDFALIDTRLLYGALWLPEVCWTLHDKSRKSC